MTVQAPDLEQRRPTGWANYDADVTRDIARRIEQHQPSGPNYLGEFMWPVEATFDAEAGRTRVGYSLLPPPALYAELEVSR